MTHEDAGHYKAKHPDGTRFDPEIADALAGKVADGEVTCCTAHKVAQEFDVAPSEVGKAADLMEYRIIECQMGLFGYSPEKRIVKPAAEISEELHERILAATVEERIPCAEGWRIAQELGLAKLAVSSACEKLGLKIKPCQLGAF
jgi:hypothetical protein